VFPICKSLHRRCLFSPRYVGWLPRREGSPGQRRRGIAQALQSDRLHRRHDTAGLQIFLPSWLDSDNGNPGRNGAPPGDPPSTVPATAGSAGSSVDALTGTGRLLDHRLS
jgi:hypothetical protein